MSTGTGRRTVPTDAGVQSDMPISRSFLGITAALAAAFAGVLGFAFTRDPSPLARLPSPMAAVRDAAYGPGPSHRLDVAFEPGRPRPAVVMIHPGGWMQGDKSAYHALMAEYAAFGYATVSLNFRPSGVARFPAAIDDCRLALRWLRANAPAYGIDPARIAVMGWSSGAHLAMLLALTDGDVQAVVAVSGVYDFLMEERGAFPNRGDDPAVVRFLGAPPREIPDVARRASPLRHLDRDDPPMLVIHGELDRRIDAEQARHLARALKALGRADEVVILPGADHGRDVLPADPSCRRRIRDFLDRRLR